MPIPPIPNPDPEDLIWIREVPQIYKRSVEWLYKLIEAGHLNKYVIPGDMKTYLLRSEIEQALRPRPATRSDAPPPPSA